MAEANNKQENDDLHDRLDKEIKTLTVKSQSSLIKHWKNLHKYLAD